MTPKQALFVEEYRALKNASEAARRAGYAPRHAGAIGSALLRNPVVIAALESYGVEIVHGARPPGAIRAANPERPRSELTILEQRFVEHYLVDGDVTQAAIRAGLSPRNPTNAGSKMLRRPIVAAAIRRERALSMERTRISADRVLRELARLSFAEPGAVADWDENGLRLKPASAIAADDRAAVAEIEVAPTPAGPRVRLRMHSKQRALETLAKHLGLLGRSAATIACAAQPEWNQAEWEKDLLWRKELRERLLRIARGGAAEEAPEEKKEVEKEEDTPPSADPLRGSALPLKGGGKI